MVKATIRLKQQNVLLHKLLEFIAEEDTIAMLYQSQYAMSPPVRDMLADDRERGHVAVLSAFRFGLGESPRSKLSVLWHIDSRKGILTVQSDEEPERPGILGEYISGGVLEAPEAGVTVEFAVERSCQKSPRVQIPDELRAELERRGDDGEKVGPAYRSKLVIVPEEERHEWALSRLNAIGLETDPVSLTTGNLRYARLGSKRRGIPYVEIRGRACVSDASRFAEGMRGGSGKGKNYGLGLIRFSTVPTNS